MIEEIHKFSALKLGWVARSLAQVMTKCNSLFEDLDFLWIFSPVYGVNCDVMIH